MNIETDTTANGYRLPTIAEMEKVAVASKSLDEAWLRPNSDLLTAPGRHSPAQRLRPL